MSDEPAVPAIIAAAGGDAVEHYRAFFGTLKASTSGHYGLAARRFCRWAAEQELSLTAIQTEDAERFEHTLRQNFAASTVALYLTGLRALFRYLASKSIIPASPFDTPRSLAIAAARNQRPRFRRSELKEAAHELGCMDEASEDFQAALVLLAPFSIGTHDPEPVSRFTRIPLPRVRQFTERLVENGVFLPDGTIDAEWDDPENGWVGLILDIGVAAGWFVRRRSPESAEAAYFPAQHDGSNVAAEPSDATDAGPPAPDQESPEGSHG